MKRLALAILSMTLFALGCSSSIDQQDFCNEFSEALCETAVKCCTSPSIDPASCQTGWKSLCERGYIAAIDARKMTYDADAAAECMSDIREYQNECKETTDTGISSCNQAVTGTIPEGGDCKEFFLSCLPGLSCYTRDLNGTRTSTCVKLAAEGLGCETAPCDTHLYCASSTRKCTARKDIGATCSSGIECKSLQCTNGTCSESGVAGGYCLVPLG